MDLTERKRSSRLLYEGRIIRLRLDEVTLPDGTAARREVVEHPGGVCILALDGQGRAAVVRQYRYVFGRVMTELPAGKREPGETPLTTARRELREEVGAQAASWTDLGALIPSPGCYGETLYLFLARDLTLLPPRPDDGEFLEAEWVPLEELAEACLSGDLQDAKTVAAVLKARLLGL
ncbi:MAG: NUDIX hydrolase [Ruminococcaceae bacterium]|nr:NUDIX hydrolase [Oscillospiraceae bacterium]